MNVLFITADQWRGECLSCLGHPVVRTPNLDRLAADGVLFTRHFAQATPCGPSRASLHTGLYALNHRSITNGTPLDARHKTLASLVRQAGFDPVLFGYTDTSADPRTLPPDSPWLRTYEGVAPGFRVELRLPEAEEAYFEHLEARGYGRLAYDEIYGGGFLQPAPFRAEDSITAFLAGRFLAWLDRQRAGEAWFAHLSFLKPHPPFVAPEPWFSAVRPEDVPPPVRAATVEAEAALHPWLAAHLAQPVKGTAVPGGGAVDRRAILSDAALARLRAVYYGLIAEVDHHLGRILEALARRGELERTLVIVTSDHGEMLGDHWMLGKSGFFPQAFHVPLIVRHPEGARGARVDAFTEQVDLMPTVLEALGLAVPLQCDGRPLSGFLTCSKPDRWRRAAHWEHDFRDIVDRTYETALGLPSDDCALAVRWDGRHAYVHFTSLPALCFDTAADPGWSSSIAGLPERAAEVLEQAQAMLSWRMRAAERRLTGCALTERGVVGRYDPL
ncbi:alkaline phosphatase family protein [Benzoatithermus flavus]|uniref:Alkaline phosphatase family protein n=1 Tax=Benzoatithermus flavus TaxID=3108223 RepID=A0ABU8XWT7_9PROT